MAVGAQHQPLELGRRGVREPASDERLVRLLREGRRSAFETIYDRYHRRILSFCRHMLGSAEDAEDATQQVFVSAHRDVLGSSKDIELRPWLFAIARNRCRDILRARRATDSLDAVPYEPSSLEGLPEAVQRREDLRELLADIATLPDDQREALVLFELGGLSQRRLAEVLDCRAEKVKALVFQARASLMADRDARDAECLRIRQEIASAHGHDLLRSHLRRHLRVCASCREFSEQVRQQRAALALVLPVLPTAGLKASTLVAAGAAGAGAAPAAPGGAGGLGALVGKSVALKAAAVVLIAGAVGGVGYKIEHGAAKPPPASANSQSQAARGAALAAVGIGALSPDSAGAWLGGPFQPARPAQRVGRGGAIQSPGRPPAAPVHAVALRGSSDGQGLAPQAHGPTGAPTAAPQSAAGTPGGSSGGDTAFAPKSNSHAQHRRTPGSKHVHTQHPAPHQTVPPTTAAPPSSQSPGSSNDPGASSNGAGPSSGAEQQGSHGGQTCHDHCSDSNDMTCHDHCAGENNTNCHDHCSATGDTNCHDHCTGNGSGCQNSCNDPGALVLAVGGSGDGGGSGGLGGGGVAVAAAAAAAAMAMRRRHPTTRPIAGTPPWVPTRGLANAS